MNILKCIPLCITLLFLVYSCKKTKDEDPLGGLESKTYTEICLTNAMHYGGTGCSTLTLLTGNKVLMLRMGDLISGGTYSISGKTLKVQLSGSLSYEFTIRSSEELESKQDGSVWQVK